MQKEFGDNKLIIYPQIYRGEGGVWHSSKVILKPQWVKWNV